MGLLDDLRSGMPAAPQVAPPAQAFPAGLPGPGNVNPPEGATTVAAPVPQPTQVTAQIGLFVAPPPPAPQALAAPAPQVAPQAPTMFSGMPMASPPVAPAAYIPPPPPAPAPQPVAVIPPPPPAPAAAPAQVMLAVGTPMPPSIPSRSDAPLGGFIVLIDCLKAKGEQGTQLIDALKPICAWLEQQYKVGHWSAISYNPHGAPGSAFLAKAFDNWVTQTRPTGTMLVDSSTAEARAVMEVLMSRADVVIRGVR